MFFSPGQTPGILHSDSLADAGCKVFHLNNSKFLYHENGTYQGVEIEHLHQMRVAARRMRVALKLFGDYLHPEQKIHLQKGLRRSGKVFGRVRDLDIFWEKITPHFESLSEEEILGFNFMKSAWETERTAGQDRVREFLKSQKYRKFRKRMLQFLAPPFPDKDSSDPVAKLAVDQITSGYVKVLSFREILHSPSLDELHKLRIAFKKFRYTLEFFIDLLGSDIQTCLVLLKVIQDHLGDLNDARVALDLLNTKFNFPESAFHTQLTARKQKELADLRETFVHVWTEFDSSIFSDTLVSACTI